MLKKITTKRSIVLGEEYTFKGEDLRVLNPDGAERTFIKEDVEYDDRDSNPVIWGRRRFLVEIIPKDKFGKKRLTHRYLEYSIGYHYNRKPKGNNPTPNISIDVDDYKSPEYDTPIILDRFTKGSPFSPSNEVEDQKYNQLLVKFSDIDKAQDTLDKVVLLDTVLKFLRSDLE